MKKLLLILFLLPICIAISCKRDKIKTVGDKGLPQKVIISDEGVVKFELDSMTSPSIYTCQEYNDGRDHFFVYLNEEMGTVYLNDFATKKVTKRIAVEGDSIKNKKAFQGVYYHNKDSIFLFSYSPRVILINESGKILQKYTLSTAVEKNKIYYRGIYTSTNSPAAFYGNSLFISSVVLGKHTDLRPVQLILNLETKKTILGKVTFPEEYSKTDYANITYDIFSSCYNSKDKSLVYSFPAYKKVAINDIVNDKVYTKFAESQYILDFQPYDEDDYKDAKSEAFGEYFMTTPTYSSILYDKYRDVYYRLALLPVDELNANYEEKNPPLKPISLVVFDKNFNYLGERLLEKNKYWPKTAFVSKDGLNIQQRTSNDATVDFSLFTFTPSK